MDASQQLSTLIELAESLGIDIRQAPSAGELDRQWNPGGALVLLKGKEILFLDSGAAVADQLSALAGALRGRRQLQERFLPPEIRQLIDQAQGQ